MLDIRQEQFEISRVKSSYRQLVTMFHPDRLRGPSRSNTALLDEYTKISKNINNTKEILVKVWKSMHPERNYVPFSPTPRYQNVSKVLARARS